MTAWYEQPYKGGPMIDLPGFPRPLYSPDAAAKGKQPSVNGPDVEAYKRVVWRLGRWPGPASGFDRAYSNAFAHGKSGNAAETGLAGCNARGKLDDTGWVGEKTFNLLRSAKVPSGIPNGPAKAGEYAMDAYAQSLLVDAWELFGGKEPSEGAAPGRARPHARPARVHREPAALQQRLAARRDPHRPGPHRERHLAPQRAAGAAAGASTRSRQPASRRSTRTSPPSRRSRTTPARARSATAAGRPTARR